MMLKEAIEAVLQESGSPLNYREITRRVLDRGLWSTTGRTPEATVSACLSKDAERKDVKGKFRRFGHGVYGLRTWDASELQAAESSTTPSKEAGLLSFTDAAESVLDRFADHNPMHYRDITLKALEIGLIRSSARTPEHTLRASILQENQRRNRRGDAPRFIEHGGGLISLAHQQERGLASQIEEHNASVRRELRKRLQSMSPADFEVLVGELLVAIGFDEVAVTRHANDGGIDVRGELVVGDVIRTRMAVQAKKWKRNVQSPIVQQVRGSLGAHEQGLIITTSAFSSGAYAEAQRPNAVPVALMDGDQLVSLLVEHEIGVKRMPHYLVELTEQDTDLGEGDASL